MSFDHKLNAAAHSISQAKNRNLRYIDSRGPESVHVVEALQHITDMIGMLEVRLSELEARGQGTL